MWLSRPPAKLANADTSAAGGGALTGAPAVGEAAPDAFAGFRLRFLRRFRVRCGSDEGPSAATSFSDWLDKAREYGRLAHDRPATALVPATPARAGVQRTGGRRKTTLRREHDRKKILY